MPFSFPESISSFRHSTPLLLTKTSWIPSSSCYHPFIAVQPVRRALPLFAVVHGWKKSVLRDALFQHSIHFSNLFPFNCCWAFSFRLEGSTHLNKNTMHFPVCWGMVDVWAESKFSVSSFFFVYQGIDVITRTILFVFGFFFLNHEFCSLIRSPQRTRQYKKPKEKLKKINVCVCSVFVHREMHFEKYKHVGQRF